MKCGNARSAALSPRIIKLLTEAWTIGSVDYGATQIRSGLLLVSVLTTDELARLVWESSAEFQKISTETLRKNLLSLTANSVEDVSGALVPVTEAGTQPSGAEPPAISPRTPSLDQFTINITAAAKNGSIDPVLGRDFEIRQIIDILTRRRQNNPILTGEAGVGKTAVVEGFALSIDEGEVPDPLMHVAVRTIDHCLLPSGCGFRDVVHSLLDV